MRKHYFEAVKRECGVITERCPHRHHTPEAAKACGEKNWTYPDPFSGNKTINLGWYNGGVVDQDGNAPAPEDYLPDEY